MAKGSKPAKKSGGKSSSKEILIVGSKMRCPKCERPHNVLSYVPLGQVEKYGEETNQILKCPSCGWLGLEATVCPIDGTSVDRYDDLLEVMVEGALDQAAGVRLIDREEVRSRGCVAALLRFDPGLGANPQV